MSKQTDLINVTDAITVSSSNVGIGTVPSGNLTSGYNLRLDGGAQTYLSFNNDTHTTQVTGGFVIGNDNGAARITQRENQPIIIGTNNAERMRIDATGAVTMPHQPAFSVNPSGTQADIAPNGVRVVAFGTERFDIGSNFASNAFTAPVTGKYQLNVEVRLDNMDTGATYYHLYLLTSNKTYHSIMAPRFTSDLAYMSLSTSVLADMDENDAVYVGIYQASGTQQTDISGDSHFSGYLVA